MSHVPSSATTSALPTPTRTPTPRAADVLVVGAGPAGLALASALADAGFTVRVLEQQPLAALPAPADDGREIAITHRGRRVMTALGLWADLPPAAIAPLREARVLDGAHPRALRFPAPSGHDGPLGWLVPNRFIRAAAWQGVARRPRVQVQGDAAVVAFDAGTPSRGGLATVTLASGERLAAPLVVAADSRFSSTRRLAGIGAAMHDYGRSAIVGRVAHVRPHDGIAWECFGHGHTLALLPMNDAQCSAVVTVPSDRAPEWQALDEAAFAARVQAACGARLGAMRAVGARHAYPLVGVYAERFVASRFALVGDAAVGMHPVTAHGWNFGLYGVEVLAAALADARRSGRDPGALDVLRPCEQAHRRVTRPVHAGTDALVALFTDDRPLPRLARRAVLDLAEHLPIVNGLVKAFVTRHLIDDAGPAPRRRIALPQEALDA